MKKRYLPFDANLDSEFPGLKEFYAVEGGVYYFVKKNKKYVIIADFGTLADFISKDEDGDLFDKLISVYEFSNKDECRKYIDELIKDTTNEQSYIKLAKELL